MQNLTLIATQNLEQSIYRGYIFSGNGLSFAYLDKNYQVWITQIDVNEQTTTTKKATISFEIPDENSYVTFESFDYKGRILCIKTKDNTLICFDVWLDKVLTTAPFRNANALTPNGSLLIQIQPNNSAVMYFASATHVVTGTKYPLTNNLMDKPLSVAKYSENELKEKTKASHIEKSSFSLSENTSEKIGYLESLKLMVEKYKRKTNATSVTNSKHLTELDASLQEYVYLDSPDSLYFVRLSDTEFEMFVGCYGFIWRSIVAFGDDGLIKRKPNTSQFYSDVVYDPVEILPSPSTEFTFAKHGYGASILAIDTKSKSSWSFPTHEVLKKYGYGCVSKITGGINTKTCVVETREGDFVWKPGETPYPLRGVNGETLAIYEHVLVSISSSRKSLNIYNWENH